MSKCIGCKSNVTKTLDIGHEVISSSSKDNFTQAIFDEYGKPELGIGFICNCCLIRMAKGKMFRLSALSSPLMKGKL